MFTFFILNNFYSIAFGHLHLCVCGRKMASGDVEYSLKGYFYGVFLVFFLLFGLWSLTACGRRLEGWIIGKIQCTFWQNSKSTPV